MPWPNPPDYNEAIQNPRFCFSDPELRNGQTAVNALGLPWPRSGNNADVYKVIGSDGKTWAVKCFTREVHGLQERYQAVSTELEQGKPPFMVRFQYLEQGIRIQGQWFPVVKMRWVEGLALNDLVKEFIDKPLILKRLAGLWLRLAQEMRSARIVHGDLQHGNVLLVPRQEGAVLRLRLIDYDGLVVPSLAHLPTGELGHPNYQHPARLQNGHADPEADRFAHLVIYTSLQALVRGGPPLWQRHDNGDNLLFREKDFLMPGSSTLLHDLTSLDDPRVQALVGHLLLASQGPIEKVPLLNDLVKETGEVLPLTAEQRDQVKAILAPPTPTPSAVEAPEKSHDPGTVGQGTVEAVRRESRFRAAAALMTRFTTTAAGGVVGWSRDRSRRSLWAVAGGITLLLVLTLLGVLAGRLSESAVAVSEGAPSGAPVVAKGPPRLEAIPALALQVGDNTLSVSVNRQGYQGFIDVQVVGLPAGVKCAPAALAAHEETAVLHFQVAADASEADKEVEVQMHVGAQIADLRRIKLTVARPTLAGLSLLPEELAINAGESRTVQVTVQRRQYRGPLEVRLEGLPSGLSCAPSVIPADQDAATLTVTSAFETAFETNVVRLTARADRHEIGEGKLWVTVLRPMGLRLVPRTAVWLPAGTQTPVDIVLDRRGYTGPVLIKLEGLPGGVTAPGVTLTGDGVQARITLTSTEGMGAVTKNVSASLWVGKQKIDQQEFRLTIEAPAQVTAKPPPPPVPIKTVQRENVRIPTVDGVQLAGTWYRSTRGRDAPCVVLLHGLGGHRQQDGWDRLAQKLQEKGYAVLSFDFRGHGDSTTIDDAFWQETINRTHVRNAARLKETIRLEDFASAYYAVLANDIAAVRAFLDRLNDEGKCNAANVILIGAQEGATLGALWLYAECHRYFSFTGTPPNPLAGRLPGPAENSSVVGAIWLNIGFTLGDRSVPTLDWLRLAGRDRRVPMTFVHGSEDIDSTLVAQRCLQELNPAAFSLRLTKATAVAGTRSVGPNLFHKDLNTEELILAYCEGAFRETAYPLAARQFEAKSYYWCFSGVSVAQLAKRKGDKALRMLPLPALGIR